MGDNMIYKVFYRGMGVDSPLELEQWLHRLYYVDELELFTCAGSNYYIFKKRDADGFNGISKEA